ncbi:hypothetical protein ACOMHN_010684 [Nucella lapillus]
MPSKTQCTDAENQEAEVECTSQCSQDCSHGNWEVDFAENDTDTRLSHDLHGHQNNDGNKDVTCQPGEENKPSDGACQSQPVCPKPSRLMDNICTDGERNPSSNVCFTLEPRSPGAGDARAKCTHIVGETGRDCKPYYSEVKIKNKPRCDSDGEEKRQKTKPKVSCSFPRCSEVYQNIDLDQRSQQKVNPEPKVECGISSDAVNNKGTSKLNPITPLSSFKPHDKEPVMTDSTEHLTQEGALPKFGQLLDNHRGCGRNDDDDDDDDDNGDYDVMVMVDNKAYQSVDEILQGPRQTADTKDEGVDGDNEEVTMVDNVAYQSVDELFTKM